MIVAEGKTTYITDLKREHVDLMQAWGVHQDPLFRSYNFPQMSSSERDYWYYQKTRTLSRKSFSVFNRQHQLVGYISLRNIKWMRRRSELGIVFDPDQLSYGYGTDGLKSFLAYYFNGMRMHQMTLTVADFNKRAQKCYERCGFQRVGDTYYADFEDPELNLFAMPQLVSYWEYFRLVNGKLQCRYLQMKIGRL